VKWLGSVFVLAATVQVGFVAPARLGAVKAMIEIHSISLEHGSMTAVQIAQSSGNTKYCASMITTE